MIDDNLHSSLLEDLKNAETYRANGEDNKRLTPPQQPNQKYTKKKTQAN